MKKQFLARQCEAIVIGTLVLGFGFPSVAHADWEILTSTQSQPQCTDFTFVTGRTGWITVGLNAQTVARTTDAGDTWHDVTMPEGFSSRAVWLSGSAWLAVAGSDINKGPVETTDAIRRSTDAGKTWEPVEVDLGGSYASVSFDAVQMADAKVGYIAGYTRDEDFDETTFVLRTQDAGKSWTILENLRTHTSNKVKMTVRGPDELFVFLLGFAPHYSADAGESWTSPVDKHVQRMAFEPGTSNALGFLNEASANDRGAVYTSTNGGETLMDTGVATAGANDKQVGAAFTQEGDIILALTLANDPYMRVLRSSDLGQSWDEEALPADWTDQINCVAGADGMVYMATGCLGSCEFKILRHGDPSALADDEPIDTEMPTDNEDDPSDETDPDAGTSEPTPDDDLDEKEPTDDGKDDNKDNDDKTDGATDGAASANAGGCSVALFAPQSPQPWLVALGVALVGLRARRRKKS